MLRFSWHTRSVHGSDAVRACARALAALCLALAAPAPEARAQAEPKRIYIANDDHTDYMWAGTDMQYRAAFLSMLDYYMDLSEETAEGPPDARSRFNCDGSLWVWEYERNRSPAQFARLVSHLRDGTITMPLQTLVPLYGSMPMEAVLRDMYYAGRLERRFGLRFPTALGMENQTLPGGVASLWAGAGARYSWRGICGCATQINAADRPREIYHFVGPDGASVCLKWNSQMQRVTTSIGGYAEARDPAGVVHYVHSDAEFQEAWPWGVIGAFGHGGDPVQSTTEAFTEASLSTSDASKRVIVSNVVDFFEDFLAEHGDDIPSFSGGFGNEWDLYTASMGERTADFKRHVEKLRTAEALATVVSLHYGDFMNGRTAARDSAFLACGLYYDHDWTADGPVQRSVRAQWQRDRLRDLQRYVNDLHDDALAALGLLVPAGGAERHVVFNPLSWTRTDVAHLAVSMPAPFHVVDAATGAEVPSEGVTIDGQPRTRIRAGGVPPLGYRVYEVRAGAGSAFPASATVSLPQFDNGLYAVTLGPRGSITSLIDHKDGDRQLVGTTSGNAIHDIGSGSGSVLLERTGPVSTTLRVTSSGSPLHETRVTMYAGIDRIDIEGLVTQNFNSNVGYTSIFNLPGASIRHEEVGRISRVARAAQGGDYADQNTRTDYLTFNHFVDFSTPLRGVTVSNWDSPFFKPGNSTVTTLDTMPRFRAVVGMQVDGTTFGIPDQGGDSRFMHRFALRTHGPYDAGAAMRMALEHQNPLVATRATGPGSAPLDADTAAIFRVEPADVLLWALKPSEEGIDAGGVIARVWNVSDTPRTARLSAPGWGPFAAARTTHIETVIGPAPMTGGAIEDALARQQIRTYRLMPEAWSGVGERAPADAEIDLALIPNPVAGDGAARVRFRISARSHVRAEVLDLRGARVAALADRGFAPGDHELAWDGRTLRGETAPPGVYFVRVGVAERWTTKKLVRLD